MVDKNGSQSTVESKISVYLSVLVINYSGKLKANKDRWPIVSTLATYESHNRNHLSWLILSIIDLNYGSSKLSSIEEPLNRTST